MTYHKLGLVLTASAILLTGCISAAPDLTASEEETRQQLSGSNFQPAPRELRDNIVTQEVLAQAAFWSHEYNLNPTDLEAAIKFSAILRKLGNPARSVEVTRTTRALYPKDPYLNAEYAAGLLATQKAKPALKIINSALTEAPAYGRLWSLKGVALDQMEKYVEARPFYNRALQITPNDPNVMANMGLNFALSGDPHTAKKWLTRAAANPDASDTVLANLELVEDLVAEAGPTRASVAPTLPSAPQSQSYQQGPAQARQYGAYQAPQTTPTRPQAQPQNRPQAAPQTYGAPYASAPTTTSYGAPLNAPRGQQAPATSQNVLSRISKNLGPKTAPSRLPRSAPQNFAPRQQQTFRQQQALRQQAPTYAAPRSPFAAPQGQQQRQAYQGQPQTQIQQRQAPRGQIQQRQAQGQAQQRQGYPTQEQVQQRQGQPAPQNQYQAPQGQPNQSGQYNQQTPQFRGSYPAPQAPYYGAPNQQQPQRRPAARRRG